MLIHPQIDPVVFALGPLKVHWYGLMYFIGFLSFIHLGKKQIATRPWFNLSEKMLDDIFFFGAIGVILGGRLGYVLFYQPLYYFTHMDAIFAFWLCLDLIQQYKLYWVVCLVLSVDAYKIG